MTKETIRAAFSRNLRGQLRTTFKLKVCYNFYWFIIGLATNIYFNNSTAISLRLCSILMNCKPKSEIVMQQGFKIVFKQRMILCNQYITQATSIWGRLRSWPWSRWALLGITFLFISNSLFPTTLSGSATTEKEKRKGGAVRPWVCVARLANTNGYDAQLYIILYHFSSWMTFFCKFIGSILYLSPLYSLE